MTFKQRFQHWRNRYAHSPATSSTFLDGEKDDELAIKWRVAIRAVEALLLKLSVENDQPNEASIRNALQIMRKLQRKNQTPPSMISREPGGGIMLEFERDHAYEIITLYNDSSMEFDHYVNGKIVATICKQIEDLDDTYQPENDYFGGPSRLEAMSATSSVYLSASESQGW